MIEALSITKRQGFLFASAKTNGITGSVRLKTGGLHYENTSHRKIE
jgi:hypothetical protein